MKFDEGKDFDQNMNQLVHLLRKIIKGLPQGQMPPMNLPSKDKDASVQINFCFFNFLPMTEEEMDAMDEMFESGAPEDEKEGAPRENPVGWNPADLEFLKRHGIRF